MDIWDHHSNLVLEAARRLEAIDQQSADVLSVLKEAADFIQPFNRAEELLNRIEEVIAAA